MKQTKTGLRNCSDPEILICDEPLTVLINARGIHAEHTGRTVDEGGTVLMSSHVMDDVQEVCDRVVLIHKGQIVVNGPSTKPCRSD